MYTQQNRIHDPIVNRFLYFSRIIFFFLCCHNKQFNSSNIYLGTRTKEKKE
jgi:hypothetical protein